MFIPVGTSETVYHRAWATFAIIAANAVLFFLYNPLNHTEILVLEYGALKPWQWITSTFSHSGFLHVTFNMIYLFFFGQIVEGRIGTLRFVAVYLGMAATEGFLTQFLTLGADGGGAIGASGMIYGLMVIALVHTRNTKLKILWYFGAMSRVFEWRIAALASMYLIVSLLHAFAFGFSMITSTLHLIGALAGLGAAYVLRAGNWWYEPPEGEVAGDVREEPIVAPSKPLPLPVVKPPKRRKLPPLELD